MRKSQEKKRIKVIKGKLSIARFLMPILVLALALSMLYNLLPTIVGFAVRESSYEDGLSLVVTSNGNFTWHLINEGSLISAKLDGSVTNYGIARVYIESSSGIKHLIFDSARLNETPASSLITGFAVKSDEGKKNKKPKWIGSDEFLINDTTMINLSQQFTDEEGDALTYSASDANDLEISINNEILKIIPISNQNLNTTLTLTAYDGIDDKSHTVELILVTSALNETIENQPTTNQTIINETINQTQLINDTGNIYNKSISMRLSYKSGTIYDADDNGEESIYGVVDLSVESSLLGWDADKTRLCTRWEVYSIENNALTSFCNGNRDCCAFFGLLPDSSNWDEAYYSTFNKDGAGYSNIVSAQALYYDVNLSAENPKSEIYYSEWSNLSVKFFEEEIEFFNACLETCRLSGLNKSSYNLVFEIEGDAVLRIDKIRYDLLADVKNNGPVLLKNFSGLSISRNKNAAFNLSEYFYDQDGDALHYNYYKPDNITMLFEGSTATIVHDTNFEGAAFTFIIANDSESFAVSNVFMINVTAFGNKQTVNLSEGSFEVRDKYDNKLAIFDGFGNANIKGALTENIEPSADENDFAIEGLLNSLNAVITNPEGNMLIRGNLNENRAALVPTQNSFIIQNKKNESAAYFNSTGSLFLKGVLVENVLFG